MPSADGSFDEFVAAQARDLLKAAYLLSRDESDAEGLVQECLVRVAKRWRRVRAINLPAAYARRILVNLAIDDGHRQRRCREELGGARTARISYRPPTQHSWRRCGAPIVWLGSPIACRASLISWSATDRRSAAVIASSWSVSIGCGDLDRPAGGADVDHRV
jgi:hypothetical protein